MYRLYIFTLLIAIFSACTPDISYQPEQGIWRAELSLTKGITLPFNFEIKMVDGGYEMVIHNAEERIVVESFVQKGDSILIQMPVFDSQFRLFLENPQRMTGFWNNVSRGNDYKIDVVAAYNVDSRFDLVSNGVDAADLEGKWETHFSPDVPEDYYPSIGLFQQQLGTLKGTFLTETGDYRYLEGVVDGNQLKLSCFDGAHAFLFEAELENDTLSGTFYSGNHWVEPWYGVRNDTFELRDPEELTFLKEGYDKLSFSFADLDSNLVSLEDPKYEGKVIILQLMGSWCPNCMDETRLYAEWYKKYQPEGLEIIGLSYERTNEFPKAVRNLTRLKEKLEVDYDLLIAKLSNDKLEAAETLPMLNHVMSFPTSIYIDKTGNIRKIHTGFSGPGTGDHYTRFVEQYGAFIEELLRE